MIPCDQITQTGNELLSAFDGCKVPKNSDLVKLVELVLAVNSCAGGGDLYNNLITVQHEDEGEVIYPPYSMHSYSLNVIEGSIEYGGFNFPQGSTRNVEYTTLNTKEVKFILNPGAKVLFEYLTEDIIEP